MKRIGLLSGLLLTVVFSFAQVKELSETTVESPKFIGSQITTDNANEEASPICYYLQNNLNEIKSFAEGVVVVLFTINADGTLSNYKVVNSVSRSNDDAVLSCLESTSGLWQPGKVNGSAVEMEKKIYVHFVDPATGSLEELAQFNIVAAVKRYEEAVNIKASVNVSSVKAEKKSLRKLHAALKYLNDANRYQPEEPAIVFWEACVYEQAGNDMKRGERLNRFMDMVDLQYQAQIESVDIRLDE